MYTARRPSAVVFRVVSVPAVEGDDQGPTKPLCMASFPRVGGVDSGAAYRLLLVVLQYLVPLVVICFTYVCVMQHVWLSKASVYLATSRSLSCACGSEFSFEGLEYSHHKLPDFSRLA